RDHSSERVIETSVFSGGDIGLITIEGPTRNPTTGDLITEVYALSQQNAGIRELVAADSPVLQYRTTGQGCGSVTTIVSDARLSMFSAAMAEAIAARQRIGLAQDSGEILIGKTESDGLTVAWHAYRVPPIVAITADNVKSCRIHLHAHAITSIRKEVGSWPNV